MKLVEKKTESAQAYLLAIRPARYCISAGKFDMSMQNETVHREVIVQLK